MDLGSGGTIETAKTYFTGEPCRNGHIAERRHLDNRCMECVAEKWKRRYAKHSSRYIETAKRHYRANPEIVKDRARRWYHDNIDRAKARRKRYYYEHREELIAAVVRWVKENREQARAARVNKKARDRGIEGNIRAEDIMAQIDHQDGKCFCGVEFVSRFTVDHIVPLSKGGANVANNIQILCLACNTDKGRKLDADWKAARGF